MKMASTKETSSAVTKAHGMGKSGSFLQNSLFVFVVSTILLSVAELILSGDVIHNMTVSQTSSSREERSYIYYFYEILLGRIVCTAGIYVCNSPILVNWSEKSKGLICVFLCGASLFLSLLSVFLQLQNYLFLSNLEACVDSSLVDVSGGESHYFQAFMCEVEHVAQYSCSCVTKSFDCFSYSSISAKTCAALTSTIRVETMWSIGFSMICSITSLLMVVTCTLALFFENFPGEKRQDIKTAKWHLVALVAVMLSIMTAYYTKKSNSQILKSPYQTLTYFDGVYHLPSNASNLPNDSAHSNPRFNSVDPKHAEHEHLSNLIFLCAGLLLGLAVVGSILHRLEPNFMSQTLPSTKKSAFKSPVLQKLPTRNKQSRVQYEDTIEIMRNAQRDDKEETDKSKQDVQREKFFDQKSTPLHNSKLTGQMGQSEVGENPDTIQLMRQAGRIDECENEDEQATAKAKAAAATHDQGIQKMTWFSDLSS